MKRTKQSIKWMMLVFLLVLLASIGSGCDLQSRNALPNQDVVVLYTNDVHCAVDTGIGYAGLAALEEKYRDTGAEVILVDCGDAIQGEPIGTISKGSYIIEIMNALGYDVATVGNHEFDYGTDWLMHLAEQAEFPYVACNFQSLESGEAVFAP